MILQLEQDISEKSVQRLFAVLEAKRYKPMKVETQDGSYIIAVGKVDIDIRQFGGLKGVKDIHRVSDAYKLVSKKWKVEATKIDLGEGVFIGGGDFAIMAGPCSIESEAQIESSIAHLVHNGVKIMRGGVYKPRSSPYSFRGLGMEGLKLWHKLAKENDIKIITEVMMAEQIDEMMPYVDIFQVGARNSQNFNLLDALGKVDKPVMLKRGISGTMDELLQSAEYIFSNGNERILLCERGIRSYENAYRNTFDINAIAMLKEKTHLPVIADPSHGIGVRQFVESIALAATMAGADGVIVEVHQIPEKALSDGQQTLDYQQAEMLFDKVERTRKLFKDF